MHTDNFAHNAQRGPVVKNHLTHPLWLSTLDPADEYLTANDCPAREFDGRRFERNPNLYPIFGPTDSLEYREGWAWHDEPYCEDNGFDCSDNVRVLARPLYLFGEPTGETEFDVCVGNAAIATFDDVFKANMLARGLSSAARRVDTSRMQ